MIGISAEGKVQLWDTAGRRLTTLDTSGQSYLQTQFSQDGQVIAMPARKG